MIDTNGWIRTGETENGLHIWAKEETMQDVRYLYIEYRDSQSNKIGKTMDYPVNQIRLLNAVIDSIDLEFGVKESR